MDKFLVIVLLFTLVFSGCATQQDVTTIDYRLALIEKQYSESVKKRKELESRLATYKKAKHQNDQELRSRSAGQYAQIDEMQEEIAAIRGKIEETEYFIKKQVKDLERVDDKKGGQLARIDETAKSNKNRLDRIEKYLDLEPSEYDSKIDVRSDSTPAIKKGKQLSEREMYIAAKKAFDQGEIESAKVRFQNLLKTYPKSTHADNAQFWIGEIYYREKWYEKAILEYQKVIEKYPKGNKVQSSLLKQGLAFYNIGDRANARLILNELIKKYPKSNEAKIAKRKLKGFTP
ncbi:MAG: tol-pal system protein YbgF [Desulfobacterales bacterium]|nr:MAG: tol-pal system protein YbgF [Desulfobacterales bacterium]